MRRSIATISSSMTAFAKSNDMRASRSPAMLKRWFPDRRAATPDMPVSKPDWASLTLAFESPM